MLVFQGVPWGQDTWHSPQNRFVEGLFFQTNTWKMCRIYFCPGGKEDFFPDGWEAFFSRRISN